MIFSIANQLNNPTGLDTAFKGFDFENQEQDLDSLDFAEFEPTLFLVFGIWKKQQEKIW